MNWLQIIKLLFQYGPQLFTLVSEIVSLIKQIQTPTAQAGLTADLKSAITYTKATQDQRPLRALRDRLHAMLDNK